MGKDNKDKKKQVMDQDEEPYNEEVEKMKRSCAKPMADDDDDKVKAENPVPLTRKCNICGKTFSNGKALGGHRRSHFQAAKGHSSSQKVKNNRFSNLSKTKTNNICDDDDIDDDEKHHTCCLCKKDFPSKNALFGHMRSHPEREWRGVYPPIDKNNTSSCSLSSDNNSMELYKENHQDDDVSNSSLPRWQKKDKRGRRSIGVYEAAENLVYFRLEYHCANTLVNNLKEKNGVKPKKSTSPEKAPIPCKEEKDIADDEPSSSEKHAVKKIKFYVSGSLSLGNKNNDGDGDKMNRGKGKEVMKEDIADWAKEKYYVKNERKDDVGFFYERNKEMKKKKGKKIKKLVVKSKTTQDSESEDKGFLHKTQKKQNGYECDICLKSFPTFQALGGHKSIHNKEKSSIITMAEPKKPLDVIAEVVMEELAAANNMGTETLLVGTPLNSEEEASSSQFVGPKVLDFDLNMPPDDMHA